MGVAHLCVLCKGGDQQLKPLFRKPNHFRGIDFALPTFAKNAKVGHPSGSYPTNLVDVEEILPATVKR